MINGKSVLAIIPARGGSKGIKLKNLRKINGVSLIGHVCNCVNALVEIDRAIISTDHPLIAAEGEKYGVPTPFWRPDTLSGDLVGDLAVLTHALMEIENLDKMTYDMVLMLQPTSPLRRPDQVKNVLNKLTFQNLTSCWTVSTTDVKYHPLKQLKDVDGRLELWDPSGERVVARQQLQSLYHRNGVAYAFTRRCLLEQKSLLGDNSSYILLEEKHISIDTEEDLCLAEAILRSRFDTFPIK